MWILGIIVLLPTLLLWVFVIASGSTQHGSDPAGNAMGRAFAALAAVLLWVFLSLLLLIGGGNGAMPEWAAALAGVLMPLSGWAALVALEAMAKNQDLKWPIVVPGCVPGLVLFYSVWSFFPSMHGEIPPLWAGIAVWGGVAAFCPLAWIARLQARAIAAAVPLKTSEEAAAEERWRAEDYRRQIAESFHKLTADSSLAEWWRFTEKESEFRRNAMEGARTAKSRHADVPAMLCDAPMSLFLALPRLDLEVTPALEEAVRKYLMKQVTSLMPYDPSRTITTKIVTEWYEQYFPTTRWFVQNGGCCDEELAALKNAVEQYPDCEDRKRFFSALEEFRKGKALAEG